MRKIYCIGGSPCSGKSTVAEILAKEHNLFYFKVDDNLEKYYIMPKLMRNIMLLLLRQENSRLNIIEKESGFLIFSKDAVIKIRHFPIGWIGMFYLQRM